MSRRCYTLRGQGTNENQGQEVWSQYAGVLRRSSQGVHQEDYVPIEQVDDWRQDLKTGGGHYEQRDWRTRGEMAV